MNNGVKQMGSMVIFHYDAKALKGDDAINVMLPTRLSQAERKDMFTKLMLDGVYQPAYVIQSDDLNIAFDCGNGYAPAGVKVLELETSHKSTSVGDIVVINGVKKMLIMPLGFEEI